jgi:hypothetical protein
MDIIKNNPQVIPYSPIIPGIFSRYLNRQSGAYYGMLGGGVSQNTLAVSVNKIYAIPFLVLTTESFNQIQLYVSTGSAGNAYIGIYRNTGNLVPNTLVLDAGTIDTTVTGTKSITINQELTPGLYWLVALFNATPTITSTTNFTNLLGMGSLAISGNGNQCAYVSDQAYGALPDPHPTAVLSPTALTILLRRS